MFICLVVVKKYVCSLRDKNKMMHSSKKTVFGKHHFIQGECMVQEGGFNKYE